MSRRMPLFLKIPLILAVLFVAAGYALSLFSRRPDSLGVTDGKLAAVPASPNCVSTQTDSVAHQMESIAVPAGSQADAVTMAESVLRKMGGSIADIQADYVHAEFTSIIFRYVDDVEIYVPAGGPLHFRSASRAGHSDLGVNRRRMEEFTRRFQNSLAALPEDDSGGE